MEGVLAADWVARLAPGEGGELGGGVEVDVGVDYGDVGCGCWRHCTVVGLGNVD